MAPELVVVVDDEPDVLGMLTDILRDEGYEVLPCADPLSALALTAEYHPALFLLDLMLPGIDGIELAERLASSSFSRVPKLAISASNAWLHRAQESGLFQETLSKPFNLDHLIQLVGRFAG